MVDSVRPVNYGTRKTELRGRTSEIRGHSSKQELGKQLSEKQKSRKQKAEGARARLKAKG
jgi:hypothetical protein